MTPCPGWNVSAGWTTFCNQLPSLGDIAIARWTFYGSDTVVCELHGFADASIRAYAAAVYVRTSQSTGRLESLSSPRKPESLRLKLLRSRASSCVPPYSSRD